LNFIFLQERYPLVLKTCALLFFIFTGHCPTIQDFARRMVGSDTISPEQLKQIREQKEVGWTLDQEAVKKFPLVLIM
jgi:hypothetical protein